MQLKDLKEEYIKDFLKRWQKESERREMKWENLRDERCPLCNRKLHFCLISDIAICKSKKHRKFVITFKTLEVINS